MLKAIQRLSKAKKIGLAIIITLAIAVLSLIKIEKQPVSFTYLDKVQHAIAYFTLSITWFLAFVKHNRDKLFIVIGCILYGIVLEFLQMSTTTYRSGELADAIANTLGVLLGLLTYSNFFQNK